MIKKEKMTVYTSIDYLKFTAVRCVKSVEQNYLALKYKVLNHIFLFQYASCHKPRDRDALSQMSQDSGTSADSREPSFVAAGDIRRRLSENINAPKSTFKVNHILWLVLIIILSFLTAFRRGSLIYFFRTLKALCSYDKIRINRLHWHNNNKKNLK